MKHMTQGTSDNSSPPGSGEHFLLTVLGKDPKPTCYELGGKEAEAPLAPVALLKFLDSAKEKPSHVLAFCTPDAERDSLGVLEKALGNRYQTKLVLVADQDSPKEQVDAYLKAVTESIHPNAEVTVDITHGPRHFSLLMYIAVLYLCALRNVRIRGAYYGFRRSSGPSQFFDLLPLLKLPDWIYALKVINETGSTLPLAKIIKESGSKSIGKEIAKELDSLSQAYLSGLPVELGRSAETFRQKNYPKHLRKLLLENRLPCEKELVESLCNTLKPFELDQTIETSTDKWKKELVKLSDCELNRQAEIINHLFNHGNVANALGLLSEWTTSWVIWNNGQKKQWLDYKERKRAGNRLRAIEYAVCHEKELNLKLSDHLHKLGRYWQDLRELRNGYAHHAMRPQHLVSDPKSKRQIEKIKEYWEDTLQHCPTFSLSLGKDRGQVLMSPIGMTPGVLFSALKACQEEAGEFPVRCLVVCSCKTKERIAEAVDCAAYKGEVQHLLLKDPHSGLDEIKALRKASRRHFIDATEVVVNVTGGTTVMGVAVQALADTARSLACPVRRFGLIDRRPRHQQEADPYRMGELCWIDPSSDSDDADGN